MNSTVSASPARDATSNTNKRIDKGTASTTMADQPKKRMTASLRMARGHLFTFAIGANPFRGLARLQHQHNFPNQESGCSGEIEQPLRADAAQLPAAQHV